MDNIPAQQASCQVQVTAYCSFCYKYTKCCWCVPRGSTSTQTGKNHEFSLTKFLETKELADVEIVVDCDHFPDTRRSFKAHRMILALQSEVFRAMLYGDFDKEESVVITDLHPQGVLGLLLYFYSGQLQVESGLQAAYTCSAAVKYLVPELAEKCVDYAKRRMTTLDVCPVIDYLLIAGEDNHPILDKAIDLLHQDSLSVLSTNTLESCSEETVHWILDVAARVPEICVLRAVFAWAQVQCLRRADNGEDVNVRKVMQPLFPKLRFLALTEKEFASGPNKWDILDDHEARALFSNIADRGSMPLPEGFCDIDQPRGLMIPNMYANCTE